MYYMFKTQDVKVHLGATAEGRFLGQILPEGGHQHTLIKTEQCCTLHTYLYHTLFRVQTMGIIKIRWKCEYDGRLKIRWACRRRPPSEGALDTD